MAQTPPTAAAAVRHRHSPIETLLEGHPGDQPLGLDAPEHRPARSGGGRSAGADKPAEPGGAARRPASRRSTESRLAGGPAASDRPARSGSGEPRPARAASVKAEFAVRPRLETASPASSGRKAPDSAPQKPAGARVRATPPHGAASIRSAEPDRPVVAPTPPAVQDVALGLLSLLAEQAQRTAAHALLTGRVAGVLWLRLVRMVSPQIANDRVDAVINALAERGRRVRQQHSESLTTAVTAAVLNTATSDAARQLTIAAVEHATDDVIAVVMPAMLQAMREKETEAALDEMMAGLLVRQLPGAMEKTLPTLLLRTATRPTALVPFLGGVLPRP